MASEPKTITSDVIEVPQPPPIAGLSFRGFRGESDYPQIAEVFTRSWEADGKEAVITADDAQRIFTNIKNFDPYRNCLIAEVAHGAQSQIVAYGRADWQDEESEKSSDGVETIRIY